MNIAEPLNLEIQGISDEVFDRFKNQMANFGVDLILCSTKNNPEKKTLSILKINSLPNIIVKKKNSDLNIKLFIHNLLNNQLKVNRLFFSFFYFVYSFFQLIYNFL